jgi:hypothetical protein
MTIIETEPRRFISYCSETTHSNAHARREHPGSRGCIPMKPWRSRVRDRVWKAFVALAGQDVQTTDLIQRTWPRKRRFDTKEYRRVRLAAAELADPVARGPGRGRPWLWRLKSDVTAETSSDTDD